MCETEFQKASTVWPGERAAAAIDDGDRDHDRHAPAGGLEIFLDGEKRGLGIERVEHGLDQQQIDAALDQAAACS